MPNDQIFSISLSPDAIARGCRYARLTYTAADNTRKALTLHAGHPKLVSAKDTTLLTVVREARIDWNNPTSPNKFTVEPASEAAARDAAQAAQKKRLDEAAKRPAFAGSLAEEQDEGPSRGGVTKPAKNSAPKAKKRALHKSSDAS